MNATADDGNSTIVRWAIASTLVSEAVTLAMRFATGTSAAEFNRTAPLLLQIHHMFWSIPLALVALLIWRRRRLREALLGIGLGLIASDLLHHFLILPLLVGNTGWHWP